MNNYPVPSLPNKIRARNDYEYVIVSEEKEHKSAFADNLPHILKRRKLLVIFPLFFIIPINLLLIYLESPTYKATTRLMIEDISPKNVVAQETYVPERSQDFYNTQYELIKSRSLVEEVVRTLQLDTDNYTEDNKSIDMTYIINSFFMNINREINTLLDMMDIKKSNRDDHNTSQTKHEAYDNPRLHRAITRIMSKLRLDPVRGTKLVDVSLQGSDPEEVARQVDMIAEVYVRRNLDHKLGITRKAINWLKGEVDIAREKMKVAQSLLQELNENKKIDLNENIGKDNINQRQLDAFSSSYVEAHTARIKTQAILSDIEKLSKRDVEEFIEHPIFFEKNTINILRSKYMDLKTQYNSLLNIYREGHVKVVQVKSEMQSVKNDIYNEVKSIKNSIQKEYKFLLEKEGNLKRYLDKQQNDVLKFNKDLANYNTIKRDIDIGKEFYVSLSKKLAETSLTEVLEDNNIKIIEKAQIPTQPISSGGLKEIFFSTILGIGFGGCLAFIVERFDKRFKTIDEAEYALEIPFLGYIPHFKINERKVDRLISLKDPKSIASESYRTIRTLLHIYKPNSGSTLLVTSAIPQEGKSTTAANLAISFAQLRWKVLLVDADMRCPTLDRIFNLQGDIGLAEILMLGVDWREAIQNTDVNNLQILSAGLTPPNSIEILSTIRMKELIHDLKTHFDIIIFDSPPALCIPDVAMLASEIDKVLLIHCPSKTGKGEVIEATKYLKVIDANLSGLVFNNIKSRELKYYHQKLKYHNYFTKSS